MKIILGSAAGFCMGVKRAMDIVLDEANRGRGAVMTHGPLIHNPQVLEMLRERGIGVLGQEAGAAGRGTVVVRAHGIRPEEERELREGGYQVVNATCPHVVRIQKLISRHVAKGDSIIIIGDHGHAEVVGLEGYAQGRGHVVSSVEEVRALPPLERVCVVSQTTQSYAVFDEVVAEIRKRWPDCAVHRTICNSTDKRQQETIEIARHADAMIIVGGKGSANTVRLAELASETGTSTFHIETADELDYGKLRKARTVGVTAGASTPNWMIAEVTERLQESARRDWSWPRYWGYRALRFLIDTNLLLAAGALATGYACSVLEGKPFMLPAMLAATLYIFAMNSLNIASQRRTERYSDPLRWDFHQRWGSLLVWMGYGALAAGLLLSAWQGAWAFGLMVFATAAGVAYRLPLIPARWAPLLHHHRRLIDISGSKDLFMGLAWAVMLTLFPLKSFTAAHLIPVGLAFFYVFTLVFIRSVVVDLRDIQGDQIMGRETIPMVVGKERTKLVLAILTGLLLLALVGATALGWVDSVGYALVIPLLYTWGYLYLYHRRSITRGVLFETILSGKFLLAGLVALLWSI